MWSNEPQKDDRGVLHTGDLVLLKTQLRDQDLYAEAGETADDTGYVCADGLRSELSVVSVDNLHGSGLDVREFLFVVVEQLNYIAQQDLKRCRKHLAKQASSPTNAATQLMKTQEERAKHEIDQNIVRMQSRPRPLSYGEVIQLQHWRTKRFLRINAKAAAQLSKTSRRVDLHPGSSSAWLRVNPFFKHKGQGAPIALNEQVMVNSVEMGDEWDLSWGRVRNMARDELLEVHCNRHGRGFYFMLYSRSWVQTAQAYTEHVPALQVLSCPSPLRFLHPHHQGYVSASCSRSKGLPYLRRPVVDEAAQSAKDIWVIEPCIPDAGDSGIEWDVTPIVLRHFGSGRYLAIAEEQLEGFLSSTGGQSNINAFKQQRRRNTTAGTHQQSTASVDAELVDVPGPASWLRLEPCDRSAVSNGGPALIPRGGSAMIRWDNPSGEQSFWLSCQGLTKGRRESLLLHWHATRYSRDALRLEVLDDPIDVVDDSPWMYECDVVAEHTKILRTAILPRCTQFTDSSVAAMVCGQCEQALSDMVFFLTGSKHWRSGELQRVQPDALRVPWTVNSQRQKIAQELKYIDATFELFHELVKQTTELVEVDTKWGRNVSVLQMSMHMPLQTGTGQEKTAFAAVVGQMVTGMKTRCLKLLVRLWLFCFLGSRKIEHYFYKNGWVDIINNLNGHGLGASDVYVALMSENAELVRKVDRSTLLKFIDFIRKLGPLDTWMSFLTAVCAPSEIAIGSMQQMVLSSLIFAGRRASAAEQKATAKNRSELMISLRLIEDRPLDISLGKQLNSGAPPPLEQCMGRSLIVEGLSDIAISWAHPAKWIVGRGVLFHGPAALGLSPLPVRSGDDKVWVSLASVVWVLQPERCCELATGRRWEEVMAEEGEDEVAGDGDIFRTLDTAPTAASRVDRLRVLARYFLAQMRLISDMVKQRQMNCILVLQEEYNFNLCVCGSSDPRLPTSIRAAFYDILTDLWLDRHPHVQVVVPVLMRQVDQKESSYDELPVFKHRHELPDAWSEEHMNSMSPEVHLFYKLGHHKMEALLRAMRTHLCQGPDVEQQVHTATDDNTLAQTFVRMLSFVLRFGFVSSVEVLRELSAPLLRCLDGRTDLAKGKWRHHEDNSSVNSATVTFQVDLPEPLTPLLQASRSPDSVLKGQAREGAGRLPKSRFPPMDGTHRYANNPDNKRVMDCKVAMLQVALHLKQLNLHTKISRVLHMFRQIPENAVSADGRSTALPPAVVERFVRTLEEQVIPLSVPGLRNPAVMCIDLLMYDHPGMFALALELLFAECCQTVDLLENLSKVELLTSHQAELFRAIKEDVAALGKLLYSFENWGVDDSFSQVDSTKFVQLQKTCLKLRSLATVGDESSTPLEIQKMLAETEFFSHFEYVIKQDPSDFSAGTRPLLAKVTGLVCSTASKFVAAYSRNQHSLYQILPNAMWLLDEQPDAALLFAEVFRGNVQLCRLVSQEMVARFGELIARERKQGRFGPWYLLFCISIVVAGQTPIVSNQALVIEAIRKHSPAAMLHLLQGEAGFDRVMELANKFNSLAQLKDPEVSSWQGGGDGELIYYIRSVDLLVGLATNDGVDALANRPYVGSLFPAASAMRLLLRCSDTVARPADAAFVSIFLRMKTLWLRLLRLLIYDVDKALLDMALLASPLHVEFMGALIGWVEAALRPALAGKSQQVHADDLIPEEDEHYIRALLLCVDSFFKRIYLTVKDFDICEELVEVASKYNKPFTVILQQTTSSTAPAVALRDTELLQATAHRVVHAISPGNAVGYDRSRKKSKERSGKRGVASSQTEARWRSMMAALEKDPAVEQRVSEEDAMVGRVILRISELTDPEDVRYLKSLPTDPEESLPDGIDFRRTLITTEAVLERFVRHSREHLRSDPESLRRVEKTLISMLVTARLTGDAVALMQLQCLFHKAGVTNMIVQILDAQGAEDIMNMAWTLLAEVLCTGKREGDTFEQGEDETIHLVNKEVQQGVLEVCTQSEDAGMWESFGHVLNGVTSKVKTAHTLRRLPSLTDAEGRKLREYEEALSYAVRVMEAVRLMVEGHFFPMQQYLFNQKGNARSCNVPEAAAGLMIKLCRSPAVADIADHQELQCVSQSLNLMSELAQGPNMRNQDFLSTMGIIETAFALLGSNFERMQRLEDDLYPPVIRRLKSSLVAMMLSLLEGRRDTVIHRTVLKRCDPQVLRARIEFVHLYFTFGIVAVAKGTVESKSSTAIPIGSSMQMLLSPAADPSAVYKELVHLSAYAMELLEDLGDEEMDELFSEGLSMLEMIYQLVPISPEFEKSIVPEDEDPFPDTPAKFKGSHRDFLRERQAYHRRSNYRHAFHFMKKFVKTIEVVLDGHLQNLHFQQPLTAMWYVHGAAKQHILDVIPFKSPDIKAKAFIQMCIKTHGESKLIRKLSRFSVVPTRYQSFAHGHLPDWSHRPFQIFLANDAKLMQGLLDTALVLGLALAVHVGNFLVPEPTTETELRSHAHHTRFSSAITERLAVSMGSLYFACTLLWVCLTACIRVPLNMSQQVPSGSRFRDFCNAVLHLFKTLSFAWRLTLLVFCAWALFGEHYWLFTFLLLDFFCQNALLATVLLAISAPIKSLAMTFLGATIVTFVYAAIGFHWFRLEFGEYCSSTIVTCTQTILYQGTRAGIVGLSGIMHHAMPAAPDWSQRMLYDMSYFIVFGIMILNTIVALIVDSFGALRTEQEAREHNQQSQTFISCIDRKRIESVAQAQGISDGFTYHETFKQHKWDYMAFIFHLQEKSLQDCTGPEQAIRSLIEAQDYKWLPIGRSIMLEKAEDSGHEDSLQRIEERLASVAQTTSVQASKTEAVHTSVELMNMNLNRRLDMIQEDIYAAVVPPVPGSIAGSTMLTPLMRAKAPDGTLKGVSYVSGLQTERQTTG